MKLLWVTYFILNINAAIDTGKYQNISVEEVEGHIDGGDLIPYFAGGIRGRFRSDLHQGTRRRGAKREAERYPSGATRERTK